jgi:hypothetical protein
MWTIVSNRIQSHNVITYIDGLHPQSWYLLQVSAISEAGNSEAEYAFLTAQYRDKGRANMETILYNKASMSYFMELEMILPLGLSILVVVAVTSLICVVMKKRILHEDMVLYSHSGDNNTKQLPNLITSELHNGHEHGHGDKTKAKTVELLESGSEQTAAIYFPSPYASVQVGNGGQMTLNGTHYTGHAIVGTLKQGMSVVLESAGRADVNAMGRVVGEECQYATVKRTARLAKADRNVYDYPVPLNQGRVGISIHETDTIPLSHVNCNNCENCITAANSTQVHTS